MKCPSCKEKDLVMSERQGIEIDYCPECRGVWLDRGELDKIIEKSFASEVNQKPPSQEPQIIYQQQKRYDDRNYYKYRKKNWLEEIFD